MPRKAKEGGSELTLVQLPLPGLLVCPTSGIFYRDSEQGVVLKAGDFKPLSRRFLTDLQPSAALTFENIVWAFAVYVEAVFPGLSGEEVEAAETGGSLGAAFNMTIGRAIDTLESMNQVRRALAEKGSAESTDHRLFPYSEDELMGNIGSFLEQVTGEKVDPKRFMEDIRASGAIHGPSHPAWYDLLAHLNWTMERYEETPERLHPAFFVRHARSGASLPVVCEPYSYRPGDVEDKLASSARGTLAKRFPSGCVLFFNAMMTCKVGGVSYSFAGQLLRQGVWHDFALCQGMVGLDSVVDQVEARFSFGNPDPRYADKGAMLARALNFMTHGEDPNSDISMIAVGGDKWFTVLPGGHQG